MYRKSIKIWKQETKEENLNGFSFKHAYMSGFMSFPQQSIKASQKIISNIYSFIHSFNHSFSFISIKATRKGRELLVKLWWKWQQVTIECANDKQINETLNSFSINKKDIKKCLPSG